MKLQPLPFQKIKAGTKTIEIRLNDKKRQLIQRGDEIVFSLVSDTSQSIHVVVENLYHFSTFKDLFYAFEPGEYGSEDRENYAVLYEYYTKEDEGKYGVVGIRIKIRT